MSVSFVLRSLTVPNPQEAGGPGSAMGATRRQGKRWLTLAVPAMLLAALLTAGCNHAPAPAPGSKAIDVIVTQPITDDVTDYQDFTGRLEALKIIDIRARVSGYVTEVPFKEGDEVKEGALLFQIDPRPYQADLNQAQANLKLAEADRKLQQKNIERGRRLVSTKAMAIEEYDQMVAASEKAGATVGAAEAARDRAKLYLDYTRVTAPVTGRVSRRFVDPGNLVNADNTILTTLVTENPIHATFDVDERTYLDLKGSSSPGQKGSWFTGTQYPVLMCLANEDDFHQAGTVNFIDNRVIATSGTIRMRGIFDNPEGTLKSGMFVRIRLPIGMPYKGILIPDEALMSDQGKKYVFLVNGDRKVEYRSVEPGQALQGLRVIKAGLKEGEQVIVTGMQRVRQGAEVKAEPMKDPPQKPHSALSKLLSRRQKTEDRRQKSEAGG